MIVYSAYVAEVYRAGIESAHPSQRMAARHPRFSGYFQMMRFVVLPQAIRRVIPPLLNDFIGLQKDTAHHRRRWESRRPCEQARPYSTTFGTFTAYMAGRRCSFVYITIPLARYTDGLIAEPREAGARAGISTSGPAFVDVDHVTKRFEENTVLREVSLQVAEHEVVCLIGASGSGKSTLLRCINLLETVEAGTIVVDDQTITEGKVDVNALRRKIGIVFQSFNLFPHLTVLQNVTLARRRIRAAKKQANDRATSCSNASGCATRRKPSPTGSPAASSSASRSCARWRWIPS